MSKQRRTFSPEFKQQAACLVLDQGYSHVEASRSVGIGESVLRRWVQQLQLERQGITPQGKAMTPDQQRIQGPEARIARLEREKSILKKGYRALDVGRDRTYEEIDQICSDESIELICAVFDVARLCLYAYRERARHIDVERMALRSRVHELFVESRSSAGSRSIMGMMREEGTAIGRFKVSRLMEELGLVCEQPGSHAYKQATVERVDIPKPQSCIHSRGAKSGLVRGHHLCLGARPMVLLGSGVGFVRSPSGGLGILATTRRGPCCASAGNGLRAARSTAGAAVSFGSG